MRRSRSWFPWPRRSGCWRPELDRHTLFSRAYADRPHGDKQVHEAIMAWHAVFGDSSRHPRYIAALGRDGYSIVAHCEPSRRMPIPERLMAAGLRGTDAPGTRRTIASGAHHVLGELRRRRVFRVSASYLIGMWILLQVAEVTFAPLHLPAWWITALTILVVVGLPIIIVLAWTYEITSDGVVRDSVDVEAAFHLPTSRRAVAPAIIVGVVLMATVTGYAWWESSSGSRRAGLSTFRNMHRLSDAPRSATVHLSLAH